MGRVLGQMHVHDMAKTSDLPRMVDQEPGAMVLCGMMHPIGATFTSLTIASPTSNSGS